MSPDISIIDFRADIFFLLYNLEIVLFRFFFIARSDWS